MPKTRSSAFTSSPPNSALPPTSVLPANSAVLAATARLASLGDRGSPPPELITSGTSRWSVGLEHEPAHLLVAAAEPGVEHRERLQCRDGRGVGALRRLVGPGAEHELELDLAAPGLVRVRVQLVGVDDGVAHVGEPAGGLVAEEARRGAAVLLHVRVQHRDLDGVLGDALGGGAAVVGTLLPVPYAEGRGEAGEADPPGLRVAVRVLLRGGGAHAGVLAARLRARGADRRDESRRRQRPRDQRDECPTACATACPASHLRLPIRM